MKCAKQFSGVLLVTFVLISTFGPKAILATEKTKPTMSHENALKEINSEMKNEESCSLTAVQCNPSFTGHQAFFQLGIKRVAFGTIDNSTSVPGQGDPTLHDFTCTQQTTITAGVPQSITVTNFTHNQEDVKVYIDYNNDGDFNDAGELAFSSDKKISHTGSITAPLTAVNNTVLRMRVLSDFFDNGIASPCENIDFGQVEEYGVTVLVPVISSTSSGQAVNDNATIDPFSGVVLTILGNPNVTATITLDDNAKGTLSGTDLVGSGPYTIASKSLADMQAAIRALTFTPTENRSATTETTTFTISINDGTTTSNDSNTTVISSAVGPNITGISIPNTAMKVGDVVTTTITVSSDTDDYTTGSGGISGTIGGFALGSLSRTNATTYTATFTLSDGGTDVAAGSDIPVSVTLTDSGGKAGNTFGTAISQASDGIDANRPNLNSIVITDNALMVGETTLVTFTFSEVVTGFTNADITIPNGTMTNVSSADGGTTYTATFTPTADVEDATNVFTVDKSGVADNAGNAGTGTTDSGNFTIDTQKPVVTITASANPTSGAFTATFTFSEDVTGFVVGDITVGNGAASNFNATSATVYTATITPAADGATTLDVTADKANDAAGNGNTAATQLSVTNDETKPTIMITASADPTSGAFTATFTFSEDVTGFVVGDVTVGNGAASNFNATSAKVYTATITPTADGAVTIDVAADKANDAAGNGNTAATQLSVTNDETKPTVTITSNAANPQSGAFTATFTFSEAVTGFVVGDITVGNGAASNFNTTSASVYTATITPAADGATTIDVAADKVNDAAGNGNTSATQLSVTNDATKPTVTITSNAANPQSGAFTATFTFSEDVNGFLVGDITVGNGAASNFNATSATIYTATITPAADGATTIDVAADKANDAAGNGNTAATQLSVTNDETKPTVTITSSADPTSGAFTATFTFSEAVTGFVVGDITVGNGAASNFNTTSASVYTATITPAADGATTIDVAADKVNDAAGNGNTSATQLSVTNDATKPTVTITSNAANPQSGAFTAIFTFSEDVNGFLVGDITVGNGAASNFNATSATVYTATITPAADGATTIDVAADKANDAAGNGNTASTQLSVTNDETKPTVTITSNAANPQSGAFTATFTFSEAVTGFASDDITVGNGAASNFNTTSATVYTATITPAADGATTIDVAADKANDAAGNGNTASTQLSVTNDETKPTVTITSNAANPQSGAFTATFTFSEAVTGFASDDITVGNGAASNFNTTSASVYTATITPAADGATTIDVAADKANDGAGNGNTAATQLSVTNDETKPTLTITSNAANPQSGAFTATFTFSEDVTGFASDDISVGNGVASNFNTTSASVYTATITPATDGATTIDVAADKANDAAGNGNTAATQLSVTNDETKPTVTITSSANPTSGAFTATFTFSEAVTGFVVGDITVGNGAASNFNTTSASIYTATITPATDGATTIDVAADKANDVAGNGNTAATQLSVTNDETKPTLTITSSANPTSGAFTATFTFSEAVTGFVVGDITVGNGAASNFNTTSASVYTATITPAADGAVTIDVAADKANDAAGNGNTAATQLSVINDETKPTVTITSNAADPQSGAFTATFTFSEDVTGFASDDISVGNGVASNFNATSASVYTATITPAADGATTIDVATDKANDAAGNGNIAATQLSVTNDETKPTITISSDATNPQSGAFTATFTFSEDVTGFASDDISVGNGVASNFNATSASVYTATITPAADGATTIDVAADKANDAAGNGNTAATQLSITNDETKPTLTITSNAANPQSGAFTATFTFSEDVTGFASDDISVGNGVASNFNAASASVYTATITPVADGATTIDVAADKANDAAGNGNTAATQLSVTNDETKPTVTITSSADPTSGAFIATFTFSEGVTGFELGDITVGNGAVSNFIATSASVYTASVTPVADGAVTVDVVADKAQDAAGNNNTAATQLSVTNDETKPSVTISSGSPSPVNGKFTITTQFSEAVTGFIETDVTTDGSISDFMAVDADTYTFSISSAGAGANVEIGASVAVDGAGNNNTASNSLALVFDITPPNAPTIDLASSSDSGSSNSDDITNVNKPIIEGTTEANASVEVFVDGASVGITNADANGDWSLTLVSALSDGAREITAKATDAAENTSPLSSVLAITIDTQRPLIPSIDGVTNDTGASSLDFITNDNTLIFSGKAEANASVQVFIDAVSIGTTSANGSGEFSFDHSGTILSDATYTLTAKATDVAGNTSESSTSTSLILDTDAPVPTLTSLVTDVTNTAFSVVVEYNEIVSGFELGDISVSNGTADNFTPIIAGQKWSVDVTPTSDGDVVINLNSGVASDVSGNGSSASNEVTAAFDGTAPVVVSINRKDSDPLNTGTSLADFRVIFSEDVSGVDLTDFEVTLTASATGSLNAITQVDNKTYDISVSGIGGEGTIGLNAKDDNTIIDKAGNALDGTFTGQVYAINKAPTDIGLDDNSIDENNAIGDVIGNLSTTDADASDAHTYTLVSGSGDTDNGSFSVDGSQLKAAESFDFETQSSYNIRIKTDDGKGGSFEQVFSIDIVNVLEPNISVSGGITFEDTALGLGSSESFTVTNTGEKAIEVRVISTPTGFTSGLSSVILAVDETITIPVTFRPLEARSYGGDLLVSYEGGERTVSLLGEGVVITSVEDDVVSAKDIVTYPNPAKTRLQIDLSKLNGQSAEVSILQMSGLKMFDREVENSDSLSIDVSKFDQGLYIVLIKTKKSIVKKKVIVRR